MQNFKGDEKELKMIACMSPIGEALSVQKDLFLEDAYETQPLGELIFDNARSPLSNAIDRTIFITSFSDIVEAFIAGGSFEAYLTVFRKIFGDDVEVEFTIPGPGQLNIDIVATGLELSDFIARSLPGGSTYVFDEVIDRVTEDNIAFQTIKGLISEYELNQMLYEMVPAGIYTEISLTI